MPKGNESGGFVPKVNHNKLGHQRIKGTGSEPVKTKAPDASSKGEKSGQIDRGRWKDQQ